MAVRTTITDLKNSLGTGIGSRKNKFLVELSFKNIDSNTINILCKSVTVPEKTIQTQSLYHHGRKYNVRGEIDYSGTLNVVFYESSDYKIRNFFEEWIKIIDDSSRVYQFKDLDAIDIGYQINFNIWQLDQDGNKVFGYEVQNAFPSSIGSTAFDSSDNDSLLEVDVTFTFSEIGIIKPEKD